MCPWPKWQSNCCHCHQWHRRLISWQCHWHKVRALLPCFFCVCQNSTMLHALLFWTLKCLLYVKGGGAVIKINFNFVLFPPPHQIVHFEQYIFWDWSVKWRSGRGEGGVGGRVRWIATLTAPAGSSHYVLDGSGPDLDGSVVQVLEVEDLEGLVAAGWAAGRGQGVQAALVQLLHGKIGLKFRLT
jgi:hypothetical protein